MRVSADLIGYIAAFLTTAAFLPQCIKTIYTKEVSGISLSMYVIFVSGVLMWLWYGIIQDSLPITIANAITAALAIVILWIKIKYTYFR
ncbi:MAG: SemiSWEET transporter [Betaproteobacteria bacterium]|nr:SemiSWEET transporter [Betaproteobacteria bacterium]MDE2423915.1 SemiSWEET transporter [Betaproteobacteria bacterium]